MALRWDFTKDRIGTALLKGGTEISIYTGNAMAIFLQETLNTYQMYMFFADKQHFRNCDNAKTGFEWWSQFELVEFYKIQGDTWDLIKGLYKHGVEVRINTRCPIWNFHEEGVDQ